MRDDLKADLRGDATATDADGMDLLDVAIPLAENRRLLMIGPLAAGLLALGITFIIPPTYTGRTTILPPQQQQGSAMALLSNLGGLAGAAGAVAGLKNPTEQYVGLLQSTTVEDHIVERFKLQEVYESKYRSDAREQLEDKSRITLGKKDNLISIEVDDEDPQRAADMANEYVKELRRITSGLSMSEAQQRRVFFEEQLNATHKRLTEAQKDLLASGFNSNALKAEPKAAAEEYATLRAQATAAELRLQALRRTLAENTPEVQQAQALAASLSGQLARVERNSQGSGATDYVGRYRDFKYEEELFTLMARQFEMARVDEANSNALIQVVDTAVPAERRSRPRRGLTAVATTLATLLLLAGFVVTRHAWRRAEDDPIKADKLQQLRAALRRS